MKDFFRKSFLFSIGAANVTREKLEEMVDTLIKKGQAKEEERQQLIEEWLQRTQELQNELTQKIRQTVETVLKDLDIPTRSEIEALNKRLEKLEARLAQLVDIASK